MGQHGSGVIDMIARAHVVLTKCKWLHPSRANKKPAEPTVDRRLQNRLKQTTPSFRRVIYHPHTRLYIFRIFRDRPILRICRIPSHLRVKPIVPFPLDLSNPFLSTMRKTDGSLEGAATQTDE